MGLRRITNDVDCLVDKPRASLLRILQNRDRWTFTHNVKEDYISFLFDSQVLFEFFPSKCQSGMFVYSHYCFTSSTDLNISSQPGPLCS